MVVGNGHPLPGVLVSLSGANFRSNNFSKEDGRLKYNKLVRDTTSYTCSTIMWRGSIYTAMMMCGCTLDRCA